MKRYREVANDGRALVAVHTGCGKGTSASMSLGDVAKLLCVSRQAVHQIERVALHKLRVALLPHLRELNPELAEDVERRIA